MTGTDQKKPLNRPFMVEIEGAVEADPSQVPQMIEVPQGRAVQTMARLAVRRGSAFGRFALWVFGGLFSLVISVAAWNFVTGLFGQNTWLGWLAFGLTGVALLVLLVMAGQEVLAFSRQGRLDHLRRAAAEASDLVAARRAVDGVIKLYQRRADVAWGLARLDERRGEVLDGDALLALTETELLAPLDRAALAEVEAAARQVAAVTALVPLALADVAVALFANLRMIRRLSEIYGGRSGRLGSLRLLRRVGVALIGAGAVGLTDDLLGSFAGGGVLAKLSRRFGEGVVNGALTARLGLAAMEELRPMPFVARTRPGVSVTVSKALAGLFGRGTEEDPASKG
jgi:putative membrane protein